MKNTIKKFNSIKTETEQHEFFRTHITCEMNNNKEEYKGKTLPNGMNITGIGKKCLKIENNFYNWDDIENAIIDDTEDEIMKNILAFIFEDYTVENNEKNGRKFSRSEAIYSFEKIKKEIIQNKEYYKTGKIVGIGEKAIAYTYDGYYNEYVSWKDVEEVITKISVKDYEVMKPSSYMTVTLQTFFYDDEEETNVEKNLIEKDVEYAEEKAYIYRQILKEDITVEKIRHMIFNRHGHEGENKCEEIINDCLQFAFKYIPEVKYTQEAYTEEDDNTYAIKDRDSYFYAIRNNKIIFSEEKGGYTFEDYKDVVFKVEDYKIQVFRGEKVGERVGGKKPIYVTRRNTTIIVAYELSVEQQVQLLAETDSVRKVSEEEIREEFLKLIENESMSEMREAILDRNKNIEEEYDKSPVLQKIAREMYGMDGCVALTYNHMINAILLEKEVDQSLICDFVMWDDSSMNKSILYEDKYHFAGVKGKSIQIGNGFDSKTYSYLQNCEYTQVEYSSAYIDSFSVDTLYLRGDVSEEDAILLFEYCEAVSCLTQLRMGYIYKKDGITVRW